MIIFLDTETFSTCDLSGEGAYKYFAHPDTELLLLGYKVEGEDEVTILDRDFEQFKAVLDKADTVVAHNAPFDKLAMDKFIGVTDISKWHCTMAMARRRSLPASLEDLNDFLGLHRDMSKADGRKLVHKFCKPAPRNHKAERYTMESTPEEWERFVTYLRDDVNNVAELWDMFQHDNYNDSELERSIFLMDWRINNRGVRLDKELIDAAIAASDEAVAMFNTRLEELTGGEVTAVSQMARMKKWLAARNCDTPSLDKAAVTALLDCSSVDEEAKDVLRLRQAAGLSSVAKLGKLGSMIGEDGRARGNLTYCGASRTGRWSSTGINMQNMARPDCEGDKIWQAVDAIKAGKAWETYGQDVLSMVKNCVRATLIPEEGNSFIVCDFSSIEGRVLAWLA